MIKYQNKGGDSRVLAYKIGVDCITVEFKDGAAYLYTYASAGNVSIETMKQMAVNGIGLNGYISSVVKKRYASKLR